MPLHKDEILDRLGNIGNVAQFVAFRQEQGKLVQSFSRLAALAPNHRFASLVDAIEALFARATDRRVNIRSFDPNNPRSREFVYGVSSPAEAAAHAGRLGALGLNIIINETIDVSDGGVSGVIHGQMIEFAPDDTPRCVEKPGVASLPRELGLRLLGAVYGFTPELPGTSGRIEFSIHPKPRGANGSHTLLWELEENTPEIAVPSLRWPNRFSRHIGDKAYGLLLSHLTGHPVPVTLVISRRVAPFQFGSSTGSLEKWIRTCPPEPMPGLFTTQKGWVDPFALLAAEDATGNQIASVLCQSAVLASYSGAAIVRSTGDLLVEGKAGEGDRLMLGLDTPEQLPPGVLADVEAKYQALTKHFGPVRFEWVHDGRQVWILQLHVGKTQSDDRVLVPGDAESWIEFDVGRGLEELRSLLVELPVGVGVVLLGDLGLTSHVADLARRAQHPTKLAVRREMPASGSSTTLDRS
jgi:hypothetical protein